MGYVIAVLVLVLILLALLFIIAKSILDYAILRKGIAKAHKKVEESGAPPSAYRKQTLENAHMWEEQTTLVHKIAAADGETLVGYTIAAKQPTNKAALIMHGHDCSASSIFPIGKLFLDAGYNLLLPEMRGNGPSGGNALTFGVLESDDAILWLNKMVELYGERCEILIYGNSLGAATTLLASAKDNLPKQVKCAVSDCSFSSLTEEIICEAGGRLPGIVAKPLFWAMNILTKKLAGFSIYDAAPIEAVKKSGLPTLFVHGKDDTFVPTEMCQKLFDAKVGLKEMHLFDGAVHAVSYFVNPEEFTKVCLDFAGRYIK